MSVRGTGFGKLEAWLKHTLVRFLMHSRALLARGLIPRKSFSLYGDWVSKHREQLHDLVNEHTFEAKKLIPPHAKEVFAKSLSEHGVVNVDVIATTNDFRDDQCIDVTHIRPRRALSFFEDMARRTRASLEQSQPDIPGPSAKSAQSAGGVPRAVVSSSAK